MIASFNQKSTIGNCSNDLEMKAFSGDTGEKKYFGWFSVSIDRYDVGNVVLLRK